MPASSAAFVNSERNNITMNRQHLENPGFTEYIPDVTNNLNSYRLSGEKRPFGVNTGRFLTVDNGVPGAGTYKLPDSCTVKQAKYEHASMRSTVTKGLHLVQNKHPGIGEYDTQHFQTIANKEFQGGASNNFVLFSKKNYKLRNPVIPETPRISNLPEPSKYLPPSPHLF